MSNDNDDVLGRTQLSVTSLSHDSEQQETHSEPQILLAEDYEESWDEILLIERDPRRLPTTRALFIRTLALLCACSLSIGSH